MSWSAGFLLSVECMKGSGSQSEKKRASTARTVEVKLLLGVCGEEMAGTAGGLPSIAAAVSYGHVHT